MNHFMGKTILITGATGLIGRNLTYKLIEQGATVTVVGRNKEKLDKVFRTYSTSPFLDTVVGNIADGFPTEDKKYDLIFHAASPISGEEIKSAPVDTIMTNITGLHNCLEHIKRQGYGRLIVFSSATVYGSSCKFDISVDEKQTDYTEVIESPSSPYSESKRMMEVLARAYNSQYGVDIIIARMGYVYGYSDPMPKTAFYEFIRKAINNQNIVMNKAGLGRRDNIHVDDVIKGLLLISIKGKKGETYNISSNGELGNFCAIDEIAGFIAQSANQSSMSNIQVVLPDNETSMRNPGIRMDNSKIKQLGWNVTIGMKDGIESTVLEYMSKKKGDQPCTLKP